MRTQSSLRVTAIVALLVVAACDASVVPSASPSSPAASPSAAAAPSTRPAASAEPIDSPAASEAPAGDFAPGTLAVTVSDRLRVRSKPLVDDSSLRYEPLLPTGTQLQVLEGPVEGSGFQWVRVAPVDVTLDGGVADGWVAIADHDGTPWVGLADAPLAHLVVAQSGVERGVVRVDAARRTAADINAFGVALYLRLLQDPEAKLDGRGVVMSPTSIATALAMARAGAKGSTASQMDTVLRVHGWDDLGTGIGSLEQILNAYNATWEDEGGHPHTLSLNMVNRAFGQDGWTIQSSFLDRIGSAFGAGLALVDYVDDSDGARETINAWVARQTHDRIKKLLGPPDVTSATRLALVNAIYLKANWLNEFSDGGTEKRAFTTPDGTIRVPTMQLHGGQGISLAKGDGWQATRLPYMGADGTTPLSMTLIRPDNLRAFERSLSARALADVEDAIDAENKRQSKVSPAEDCTVYPYDLQLFLPRFGIETRASLVKLLGSMGMKDAIDPARADFSGITGGREMYIAGVVHQANIDVDEKGTEAAAATAVLGDTGGCAGPVPLKWKTLRVDRPFMYLIRDTRTGAILFMGRVLDPTRR